MATYRYVSFDLLTSLKKISDDADIRLNQVVYWVQVIANRIRVDHYMKTQTGLFTSTFRAIEIKKDADGKKYFDLPQQIMDLPDEQGIEMITYCASDCDPYPFLSGVFFEPTTIGEAPVLSMDEYTEPKTDRPYFYRVGDKVDGVKVNRVYLLGLDCIEVDCLDIAIKCSLDPSSICSLDDEIPIPDERIKELMDEILTLGRFVMMIPEERVNQGSDEVSPRNIPEAPSSPEQ